jgi:hypothetical protein
VPGFIYGHKENDVYVNLYIGGEGVIQTTDGKILLKQQTDYPWKGDVKITVESEREDAFAVLLRIPGWARNECVPSDLYRFSQDHAEMVAIRVNGKPFEPEMVSGYARIKREWQSGDTIDLHLPMPIRRIYSHENIQTNRGRVALQRGPVVFCLEGHDNDGKVLNRVIPEEAGLTATFLPDKLGGVMEISGGALTTKRMLDGTIESSGEGTFNAIPYYAWAHRGRAHMTVWPAEHPEASRPEPADTLAYLSRTTASFVHVSLDAIKDQVLPANSADASNLQLDFWPHKGTTEWVMFEWDEAKEISRVEVYWFDDTGRGACHLPASWKILYRDTGGVFKPVENHTPYETKKDGFNRVEFDKVNTSAIKIEIQLQPEWSAGIQEVVIESGN